MKVVKIHQSTHPLLITPSLHHSIIPSFHHSTTPSLHHSIIPSFHHSIIPKKMSLPNLAAEQGQIGGWEFAKLSFPVLTLGAPASAGLPASRRYSPRQAESSAS